MGGENILLPVFVFVIKGCKGPTEDTGALNYRRVMLQIASPVNLLTSG